MDDCMDAGVRATQDAKAERTNLEGSEAECRAVCQGRVLFVYFLFA